MRRFFKKCNTESNIKFEPNETEKVNKAQPLIVDGLTQEMTFFHDEFQVDDKSTQLTLSVRSMSTGKTVGKLHFNFGDNVLAHRISNNSIVTTIEDIILEFMDNNPDYVAGAPILMTESEFLDWYIKTYRETNCQNIVHFFVYSVEYYYEFILNALPEITFIKNED